MIPLDPPLAELAARIRAAGAPPPFSGTPAEALDLALQAAHTGVATTR